MLFTMLNFIFTFVIMEISDRIKKIIEYYNYTSSEFADTIDVPRSSVSHITSGRNRPSLDFIIKVKNRFPELRWDWLIDGMGEMTKEKEDIKESEKKQAKNSFPLPDLFNLPPEETSVKLERKSVKKENTNSGELNIYSKPEHKEEINDSQRLDEKSPPKSTQSIDNQTKKLKRVVLFFDNGSFEAYET